MEKEYRRQSNIWRNSTERHGISEQGVQHLLQALRRVDRQRDPMKADHAAKHRESIAQIADAKENPGHHDSEKGDRAGHNSTRCSRTRQSPRLFGDVPQICSNQIEAMQAPQDGSAPWLGSGSAGPVLRVLDKLMR